jgi:hypothetical protein
VQPGSLLLRLFTDLSYHPWIIDGDDFGVLSVMNEWQGKPRYSENCPTAALAGIRRLTARATAQPNDRITN